MSQNIRAVRRPSPSATAGSGTCRVRPGQHVRLGHPREALDRRPVEADALVEGTLELGRRHGHRLEEAQHVGEPQPHEADVALLERPEDELLLLVHGRIVPGRCFGGVTRSVVPPHQRV